MPVIFPSRPHIRSFEPGDSNVTATVGGVNPFNMKQWWVTGVNITRFHDWMNGRNIQDALPNLSANEREMLISGIDPAYWDSMFKEEGTVQRDLETERLERFEADEYTEHLHR